MLKTVPVCGGSWDLTVSGSTCGRAGRRFRRIIFLVFFWAASGSVAATEVSEAWVRAVSGLDVGSTCSAASSGGGLSDEVLVG